MSYQTVVAKSADDLPITLEEAKQHLRLFGGDLDTEVQAALEAAVDYCETVTGRALRQTVTVTQKYSCWPKRTERIQFDRQPVKSITSVVYRDVDDAEQTVSSSDYRLHLSTESAAGLEFLDDYLYPSLYDRWDAITLTYVAGYTTAPTIPPRAKHAIKLKLGLLFGNLDDRQTVAAERACGDLLHSIDWGVYR